jgi:hypothetical protein
MFNQSLPCKIAPNMPMEPMPLRVEQDTCSSFFLHTCYNSLRLEPLRCNLCANP